MLAAVTLVAVAAACSSSRPATIPELGRCADAHGFYAGYDNPIEIELHHGSPLPVITIIFFRPGSPDGHTAHVTFWRNPTLEQSDDSPPKTSNSRLQSDDRSEVVAGTTLLSYRSGTDPAFVDAVRECAAVPT